MMPRERWISVGLVLMLCACQRAAPPAQASLAAAPTTRFAGAELARVVERYWAGYLVLNPSQASASGDRDFDAKLENTASLQYLADSLALERGALAELAAVPPAALNQDAKLTYDIFLSDRGSAIEQFKYPQELLPVNPFEGMAQGFALMGAGLGAHSFADAKGYEDWLSRIDGFVEWSHQAIANLREGQRRGYLLPRVLVERTLPQLAELGKDSDDNVFYRPLRAFPTAVSPADRARIAPRLNAAIEEKLLPAYRSLHDYLRGEYLFFARKSIGWSSLPMGEAWYGARVRRATGNAMTPAQVHAQGLVQVERFRAGLLESAAQSGFPGNLAAFYEYLAHDPLLHYQTQAEMLEAYGAVKRQVLAALPTLIGEGPASPLEIVPMARFLRDGMPRSDYIEANSGARRGAVLQVNTDEPLAAAKFELPAAFLNPGIPGRHMQQSIQRQRVDLPAFRRFGAHEAFIEGWSAYAESLAEELGLNADPHERLSTLLAQMRRAALLVVDTGVHARGWSRKQAMDYLRAQLPVGEREAGTEVDAVLAMPGRALAAPIGELKFKTLRSRAQAALGPRFDIRAFHDELLRDGSMPLDILDAKMDRWIKSRAYNPAP